MNNCSSHVASSGSPKVRKVRRGNASVNARVLLIRHGPCADLLVFHALQTVLVHRNAGSRKAVTLGRDRQEMKMCA